MQGLHDEFRPGRPRTYDDEKVAELNRSLKDKSDNGSAWSVWLMAPDPRRVEEYRATLVLLVRGQAYLSDTFKLSSDPFFIEKVRDVNGFYLIPGQHDGVVRG